MTVRDHFNSFHPLLKLIFDLVIVLIVGFFFFVVLLFFTAHLNGYGMLEFFSIAAQSAATDIVLYKKLQVIYSLSVFLAPPFLIAFIYSRSAFDYLRINKSPKLGSFFLVILLVISLIPIVNILGSVNSSMHLPSAFSGLESVIKEMEQNAKIITDRILNVDSIGGLISNIIIIALLPALGEEFFFRGILQRHFTEWFKNEHWAIIVTAFLFSSMHLQFLSFLPRFFLGIILGYLFVMSKSLWLNITAHFVNNAIAVIAYYIMIQKGLSPDSFDSVGIGATSLITSIVFFVLIFYSLMRLEKYRF